MHETTSAPPADRCAETSAGGEVSIWTTVATVAMIPVAFVFGALAGMAEEVHPQTVAVLIICWWASWTVTPLLVVASRLPLRHRALARARRWAGWIAPLPPTITILLSLSL
ncbi:hypothetical protein ABZ128_10805 [Streptomyces sp. NPDC006326]|uniref:hypothetical protein n=1 Tax=Streptomyces sp. NPDC006326 TaxID=3156752 RepID=UPI0033B8F570